jgi:hypothetical protein
MIKSVKIKNPKKLNHKNKELRNNRELSENDAHLTLIKVTELEEALDE